MLCVRQGRRQRGCSVVASGGSGGNGGSGDGGSDGGGDGGGEGGGDGVPVTTTRPPREGRTRRPQMVAGEARSRGSDLPGCLSRPEPVWMDSFRVAGQYATTKDKSWWPVQAALRASASWPRSEVDSLSRPIRCGPDTCWRKVGVGGRAARWSGRHRVRAGVHTASNWRLIGDGLPRTVKNSVTWWAIRSGRCAASARGTDFRARWSCVERQRVRIGVQGGVADALEARCIRSRLSTADGSSRPWKSCAPNLYKCTD